MTHTHLYLCGGCDAVVAEGETHGLRVVNAPVAGTSGVGDAPCPQVVHAAPPGAPPELGMHERRPGTAPAQLAA